ncbi:hypothetical protein [Halorubrum sp. SD626R]|nr:hypothetical protein [Halorubrum sp. SD626R]
MSVRYRSHGSVSDHVQGADRFMLYALLLLAASLLLGLILPLVVG